MILGTPRRWWIAAAIPLVLGIALIASGAIGPFSVALGVLLLLLAMVLFAAAPMRYGQQAEKAAKRAAPPPPPQPEPLVADSPPLPRPTIDARDASDV